MIIAIDGPSGSGKSSISKEVSRRLGLSHLDTGAMYRLLGYKILKDKLDIEKIDEILENLNIDIKGEEFFLDSENVTNKIRENEVSKLASQVSKIKVVRDYMVFMQRKLSENKDIVLDGRDIGTVVFPNADIKIFLTASVEVRAKRRYQEDNSISYEKILEDIIKRDYRDENRKYAPLKKADDAILINTDELEFEEVVEKIIGIVKNYENKSNN